MTGLRSARAERRRRVVAAVIVFAMVLAAGATVLSIALG
jgi:type IV secretory pathway component VirB8